MQQSNIKDVLKEIFLINGNNGDLWEKMINILNNKDDQQQAFFKYMKSSVLIKPNKELNLDILDYIGHHQVEHQVICGFAMETQDLIENASKKLNKKQCDLIIANHLKTEGA